MSFQGVQTIELICPTWQVFWKWCHCLSCGKKMKQKDYSIFKLFEKLQGWYLEHEQNTPKYISNTIFGAMAVIFYLCVQKRNVKTCPTNCYLIGWHVICFNILTKYLLSRFWWTKHGLKYSQFHNLVFVPNTPFMRE